MRYLFGDSDLAAHRLEVLARVYRAPTEAFLRESVTERPSLAVDLGCGPGFTTHLIAETLSCERAIGLDNSEHFISLTRPRATSAVSFQLHDVTQVPFPAGSCDLIYARYLLTHLRKVDSLVQSWGTQLRPLGLLLLEEPEWIRTDNPAFNAYLTIVEAMLGSQGSELYAGRVLDRIADTDRLQRRSSVLRRYPVSTHDAATLFTLNIGTWKSQPFIDAHYDADEIHALEKQLKSLIDTDPSVSDIEWGLRQIAFERGPGI